MVGWKIHTHQHKSFQPFDLRYHCVLKKHSVARNNMDFSNNKIWESLSGNSYFLFFLLFQEVVGKGLFLYLFCIWKNFVSPLPSTWTMDMWWELFFKNIPNNWLIWVHGSYKLWDIWGIPNWTFSTYFVIMCP